MMNKISILDTSVATRNMGDEIIVDSVKREISSLFKHTMFFNIPTHEIISRHSRRMMNDSDYSFVAGTNLLASKHNLIKANQWNINILDAIKFNRVVLIGAGWTDYQDDPGIVSKFIYKNALDSNYLHSVRDEYTKKKLNSIGIKNVVNTGCPTMWGLTPDHCKLIPKSKADNVVFTLTDYRKDKEQDKKFIDILFDNYEKVYFWVQGSQDADYILTLSNKVEIVAPTLKEFDNLLDSSLSLDYIGTRLHAGIRAMQKGRRSIIIGVDNRALEKQKDFNINVVNRKEIQSLSKFINTEIHTDIKLNFEEINRWKNQFVN